MSPPTDDGPTELFRWLRTTDEEPYAILRDVVTTVAWVVAIGLLLFAVSGVWPPMVAVESGSMEPHMERGDLVFVVEEGRLAGDAAHADTGVVTHRAGREADYREFGDYGDVIIFEPDGKPYRTPVIHRARFWVDEGENWHGKADGRYVAADGCEEMPNCPAPRAGFVTKGDDNRYYDQAHPFGPISGPVEPAWVLGKAKLRVPWLGWIRLRLAGVSTAGPSPGVGGLTGDGYDPLGNATVSGPSGTPVGSFGPSAAETVTAPA